ncbi:hypothetical protein Adt_12048 [Abeliophyllum distichum]|uniref:Uncharacterized protein n=1 Tax=Abeliophyllum distichum TaxID=126358 RepID=A0ABD1UPN0_9LAMI
MSIFFSDDDLLERMPSPYIRALHITAYICIPQDTLLPSPVFVTAYDNSRRAAKSMLVTNRTLGPLTLTTAFNVIDIVTSFNLCWEGPGYMRPVQLRPPTKNVSKSRFKDRS